MPTMIRGGFIPPGFQSEYNPRGWDGIAREASRPIYVRGYDMDPEFQSRLEAIQRGESVPDMNQFLLQLASGIASFQRTITSSMTAFPVRENLEAPARLLVPVATPMRNRIPRVGGAGTATAWRQLTSLGGGYGVNTTVTTGASSATQTVGSTSGMQAGDVLYFATTNATRIVSSVTDATTVVLTATISTTTAEVVTKAAFQPGTGTGAIRSFFAETGAPAARSSVYAPKSASYKLLGTYGDITGFAMAAGANYQNQYATEKTNAIRNLMLNEENALINGSSTVVAPPWGDGTNALGFDGLRNLITTANGVPTDQVQTAVGALTFAHIDAQLARLFTNGGEGMWMLCNEQEVRSIDHLFDASGSTNRVVFTGDPNNLIAGRRVTGYVHPITGEIVTIIASRFMPAGTILYGCDRMPDGGPSLVVDVLPQVQLPQLAPDEAIQGYTAQELAPTTAAPQVYPFICTVYEVLKMYAATVFAKSTGVTAV